MSVVEPIIAKPVEPREHVVVGGAPTPSAGLDLVAEMEALPANPTSSMRVLSLADDPKSSAADLGGVCAADPSLTARVMKLANSAYYGLGGRVGSATFAVTVLGFDTVRAIAAATAGGVTGDNGTLPDGFWAHAAAVAVGCSVVAPRASVRGPEAFSLGLLHDLGSALLHRGLGPLPDDAPSERDWPARMTCEIDLWGIDHATATGRVLAAWWFPEDFTHAIANHHGDPGKAITPLAKVLVAGEALAAVAVDDHSPARLKSALATLGLGPESVGPLREKVKSEAQGLAASLGSL